LPWVVNATDETFGVEAKASPAVLVDLWAPWCGPCRFVSPILEQLAAEFPGRLKVVKVNVDENPKLAREFDARSIPTMLVLQGGRVVDRIVGAMPKQDLTVRLTPYPMRRSSTGRRRPREAAWLPSPVRPTVCSPSSAASRAVVAGVGGCGPPRATRRSAACGTGVMPRRRRRAAS
jgi:thioredoxin 2